MTEDTKKKIMEMIQFTQTERLVHDLDEVRQVLYALLIPVISEIKEYDSSDEDNEEKIESLFQKKDMIEQSIGRLNRIIVNTKQGCNK